MIKLCAFADEADRLLEGQIKAFSKDNVTTFRVIFK